MSQDIEKVQDIDINTDTSYSYVYGERKHDGGKKYDDSCKNGDDSKHDDDVDDDIDDDDDKTNNIDNGNKSSKDEEDSFLIWIFICIVGAVGIGLAIGCALKMCRAKRKKVVNRLYVQGNPELGWVFLLLFFSFFSLCNKNIYEWNL